MNVHSLSLLDYDWPSLSFGTRSMDLLYADIENFRSLASVRIDFETRCRILVGINESGKTNILRALALLDPSNKPVPEDLRDFRPDEDPDLDAYIDFVFGFDKAERVEVFEKLEPKLIAQNQETPIIRKGRQSLSFAQFCDLRNQAVYRVNLRTGLRSELHFNLPEEYVPIEGWYVPKQGFPPDGKLMKTDGNAVLFRNSALIYGQDITEPPHGHLAPLTATGLNKIVGSELATLVRDNLPDCLYWSYSEGQLLPPQVSMDAFAANPSSCEPLKQMFILAGFQAKDIHSAITEARKRASGIRNLLNRVATLATKHMRSVWRDYRGITIALEPNGPNIDASVRDEHNVYHFAKRSDGFKRFITFLLLVSAKAKTDELTNTLYLQDEPDTGLHPTGSRYLRDELIKIAENNYVVFSTHSIFMIDRERVERHLIVEKKGEVTSVREVNESNITDEEVIYNALGYSLFENLRADNLIFEGYRDKMLFQAALRSPTAKKIKKLFKEVGICHAKGVKDIARITPLLELARRRWLVVSDGDRPAAEQQKSYDGPWPWVRYDELLPNSGALTGEDFIKPEAFSDALKEIEAKHAGLPALDMSQLQGSEPKLTVIRKWLQSNGVSSEDTKSAIDKIKEAVFAGLKPSHVEDKYFDLLAELAKRQNAAPRT